MPTLMPKDTRDVLGSNAEGCDSRSLLLDRFCDPTAEREGRQKVFTRAFDDKKTEAAKSMAWGQFGQRYAESGNALLLYAQLQSRLMVNMAGGVMENAGLCLDRFGLPCIPGSAVKGCARRAATFELLESDSPESKADLLFRLALVFGWGDTDWKAGRNKPGREVKREPYSDFWWAMAPDTDNRTEDDERRNVTWQQVAGSVAKRLLDHLRITKRDHPDEPWHDLPNFAGSVAFLPAYPVDLGKAGKVDGLPLEVPPLGKLELDVVTCHHSKYYQGDSAYALAPDTEEPVPVVFPAVAPGHILSFTLAELRRHMPENVKHARAWLMTGLDSFGLGAKTNAGYGWFDASDTVHNVVARLVGQMLEQHRVQQAKTEQDLIAAEAKAAAQRMEQERLANAPAHERFKVEYGKLGDEPFAGQAKKFEELSDDQRHGFILALKERRDTTKRWAKKKPELLKPWQDHAKKLQPPVQLP